MGIVRFSRSNCLKSVSTRVHLPPAISAAAVLFKVPYRDAVHATGPGGRNRRLAPLDSLVRKSGRETLAHAGETRTVLNHWSDSSSGNKILGGLYLQIATEWNPKDYEWSLKTLLRADIGQSFSQKVGPSRFTDDADGFTAAVMMSHPL